MPDPARLPRAAKNAAEIAGARAAHRRDGAAVSRLLAWLDRQQPGTMDEIAVVKRLEESRVGLGATDSDAARARSPSTPSPAPGPTAPSCITASPTGRNRRIEPDSLFLLDSGGQYQDGTTDITRTVAIGMPSEEMRQRFTIVLKGMIAISRLRFPAGTRGGRPRCLRPPCPLAGRARFCAWHRPRRRFLSLRSRGAAAHRQDRHREAAAGHDPVQRARLLQGRRIRHPHREPDRRLAGRADRRGRNRHARLRDADAGAVRPPADRGKPSHGGRARLARRLSCPRALPRSPRCSTARTWPGWKPPRRRCES